MPEPTLATSSGVAAIVSGLGAWLLKTLIGRELERVDKRLSEHSQIIRDLQSATVATASELSHIRDSLTLLRGDAQRSHSERMDEMQRLHDRIDMLLERQRER